MIEIQSKLPLESNPSDYKYRVNTYMGNYKLKTGTMVSFFPEDLEFLEPGYTPTEEDNVVIYPTGDSSNESHESSSNTNNSGWSVKTYVDEFGDQTGEEFCNYSVP